MPKKIDMIGFRSGKLEVIQFAGTYSGPQSNSLRWLCRCDCGNLAIVAGPKLRSNSSRSCGCLRVEQANRVRKWPTPADRIRKKQDPAYTCWVAMRARCRDPKHVSYKDYGGRGIAVCDRWDKSFAAFLADMGPRPSMDHTIDRIEGHLGYEPGNCRWLEGKLQLRNRRGCVIVELNGEEMVASDAADRLGKPLQKIHEWMKHPHRTPAGVELKRLRVM